MFRAFESKKKKKSPEITYWLSISDLMASILIIFILFFVIKINSESKIKKVYDVLFVKQLEIVNELKEVFKDFKNVQVLDDGTIYFFMSDKGEYDTWFDRGKWELREKAKLDLEEVIPTYLNILISKTEPDSIDIEKIIIEGHTDNSYRNAKTELDNYLHNLQLSQQRAFSVSEYIQEKIILPPKIHEFLKQKLTANGRSYVDPFLNRNGEIDSLLCRRVEIKFKLDFEKEFKEIKFYKNKQNNEIRTSRL
ncbi:MAG: OmpA family protein [Ignavibacteriales bacterium]|nr:OmpA family protein [Ignavibacteriales bacterium]